MISARAMHEYEIPLSDRISLNERIKKPLTGDGCEGHVIP
jgi:hypothetical protein